MNFKEFKESLSPEEIEKNRKNNEKRVYSEDIRDYCYGYLTNLQDSINEVAEVFRRKHDIPDSIPIIIGSSGCYEDYELNLQAVITVSESNQEVIQRLWNREKEKRNKERSKESQIEALEKKLAKLKKEN